MKTLWSLGIGLCAVAGLSYGETFSGKLMDAECYRTHAATKDSPKTVDSLTKSCAPKAGATTFAVKITDSAHHGHEGLTLKLDDKGNALVASQLQAGTLKLDNDQDIHVVIKGRSEGDAFFTDSVSPEPGHGEKVSKEKVSK